MPTQHVAWHLSHARSSRAQLRPRGRGAGGVGGVSEDPSGGALPAQGQGAGPTRRPLPSAVMAACCLPVGLWVWTPGPPGRACFCSSSKVSQQSPTWSPQTSSPQPTSRKHGQGPHSCSRTNCVVCKQTALPTRRGEAPTRDGSVSHVSRGRVPEGAPPGTDRGTHGARGP